VYVQSECVPREQGRNSDIIIKVLLGPIQRVWNRGRNGFKNVKWLQECEIQVLCVLIN